jgi:hypothetical protein
MTGKPKGRRLGGPPATLSTVDDTTPPQVPDVHQSDAAEQGLVPVPDQMPAPAPPPRPVVGPVREATVRPRSVEDERPRAEDLVTRRTHIEREQINGMVPTVLRLRRRMRLYELDHGMQLRDQMAVALDTWLRLQGY